WLFSYYLKQHTATLDRAPIELQNRMIATIKEDHRPQYLIADSDLMRALIERTAGAVRVQNMFGYETYRLNPPSIILRVTAEMCRRPAASLPACLYGTEKASSDGLWK